MPTNKEQKRPSSLLRVFLLLWLAVPCFAQNRHVTGTVFRNLNGYASPVPAASVVACTQPANTSVAPCTPLAPLCSSSSDTTCSGTWPATADANGNYDFYVPPNATGYTLQFYGAGLTPYILADQGMTPTANLNGQLFVGGNIHFGGSSDIIAQINSAYASGSCSTTGCEIANLPGTYTGLSGTATFGTLNKPVLLRAAPGTVSLTSTIASGAFLTFDWGFNPSPLGVLPGAGIAGHKLIGNGGTSIGVKMSGGTNGAPMAAIRDSNIQLFGTNVSYPNFLGTKSSYGTTIIGSHIQAAVNESILIDGPTENTRLPFDIIANNQNYGLRFTSNAVTDSASFGTSWDSNGVNAIKMDTGAFCTHTSVGDHFEDNAQSWEFGDMQANNCQWTIMGGEMLHDGSGTSPDHFVHVEDGTLIAVGVRAHSGGAINFAQVESGAGALLIGVQRTGTTSGLFAGSGAVHAIDVGGFPQEQIQENSGSIWQIGSSASVYTIKNSTNNKSFTIQPTTGYVAELGATVGGGTLVTMHQHKRISTGSIGATTRAEVVMTWATTFGDASYTVNCSVEDSTTAAATQGLTLERIRTKSATQVGAVINNPTAGGITGTLDCIADHD